MNKHIVLSGAIMIVLSITLGAFGAHGLKNIVDEYGLEVFTKGTNYQMYMGIALLAVGLSADKFSADLKWVHRLAVAGVVIFSGMLYILAFKSIQPSLSIAGAIVPIGGILMILAWILFISKIPKK